MHRAQHVLAVELKRECTCIACIHALHDRAFLLREQRARGLPATMAPSLIHPGIRKSLIRQGLAPGKNTAFSAMKNIFLQSANTT
jgi:hypothetical protein